MSNINPSNPPVLASGPAAIHSPDLMAFTHPHPVDQQEIQFDISRRRRGVCKFFNSQKGFGLALGSLLWGTALQPSSLGCNSDDRLTPLS
ncbi:hypothetical protein KEM48_007594 [Puccinia striiformis f. sp. tritici PST-130]|nr:hypothetical protein KEM48_007594 [Puccinia striiformis f. sp. tritici PST-130]